MFIEAILLGLSTGTYCAMYCGPVLIPFLMGTEKVSHRRNGALTATFLASRLVMYFILGGIFGALGLLISDFFDPYLARRLSVYAYIFCGLSLLLNSLGVHFPWTQDGCKCKPLKRFSNDYVTAVFTGLAVGLHICPPMWTAIARSVFGGHGITGFFYLVFFYIGTLPFFIPLLGIPFLQKALPVLKKIARITQLLIGLYFLIFEGLLKIFF